MDHCILILKHPTIMHFITNGYKRFFIDQLVRSKATCLFKEESPSYLHVDKMYEPKASTLIFTNLHFRVLFSDINYFPIGYVLVSMNLISH